MKVPKDVEIQIEEDLSEDETSPEVKNLDNGVSPPPESNITQSPTFKFSETGLGDATVLTNKINEDLSGECETGSKVEIKYGSTTESVDCSLANKWSYSLDSLSQEGETQIKVTQINSDERSETIERKIQLDKTAPQLSKVEGGNQVKDRNTAAVLTIAISGAADYDSMVKIAIYDDSKCQGAVKSTLANVAVKSNKIKVKMAKLGTAQSLTKYLKLTDKAGNESNCLSVIVSLTDSGTAGTTNPAPSATSGTSLLAGTLPAVQNAQIQIGVVLQDGAFQQSEIINDVKNIKLKLNAVNATSYGVYHSLQSCQSAASNSLINGFTDGSVVAFPIQGFQPTAGNQIVAYARFANGNKKMSDCVTSSGDGILFDNKMINANTLSSNIEIGVIPFGERKLPDLRIKQFKQNPEEIEKIDRYLISIKEVNVSGQALEVGNCKEISEVDSNDDGGVVRPISPSFGGSCFLTLGKKYAYSIIAVDQAGNRSPSALSMKWMPRGCPAQNAKISNDSFLAMNVGSDPFCVAKYETRKQDENPIVSPGGDPKIRVWTNINYEHAKRKCESLGLGFSIINNDQWMTIAREIVKEKDNWIPQGSYTTVPDDLAARVTAARLKSGYQSKNSISNDNPVNDRSSGVVNRKFKLLGDQFIYDFGGNAAEWVLQSSGSSELLAAKDLYDYTEVRTHPYREFYPQSLGGISRTHPLWSSAKYFKLNEEKYHCVYANCGFGKVELQKILGLSPKAFDGYALVRGGRINKGDDPELGIFAVEVRDRDNGDDFIGFRCVYKDTPIITK